MYTVEGERVGQLVCLAVQFAFDLCRQLRSGDHVRDCAGRDVVVNLGLGGITPGCVGLWADWRGQTGQPFPSCR